MAAVVLIHTTQTLPNLPVDSYEWIVLCFYDGLAHWAVPVFVMISGVLFLDPRKPQPVRKLYSKNILKILVIILVWGFIYAAVNHPPESFDLSSLWTFAKRAALGHYHMWFLYMIAGLYALVPLLRCITASEQATRYFLVLAGIVNCVLPFLGDFGPIQLANSFIGKMLIQLPVGYSFYFVLGYWLHSNPPKPTLRKAVYGLGVVGAIGTVGLTALLSSQSNSSNLLFFDNFSPTILLMSVAIFVFFENRPKIDAEKPHPVIALFSKATLGVYLVHVMVLDALQNIGLSCLSFNPLFAAPLTAACAIAASFAIAALLTKIPIFGRYCI